jgi:hypothetical protein
MNTGQTVLDRCREMLRRGAGIEDVLRELRDGGLSKVHSMKALVDLGYADLAQAKEIVHRSQTWQDVRERDEKFQSGLD